MVKDEARGTGAQPPGDPAEIRRRIAEVEASEARYRQMAEAMRKERDIAQTYLDVVDVILVAIDDRGEVSLINRKGCRVLGYREEEIVGRNWFDHFLPASRREETKSVFQMLMAGETEPSEYYENPVLTKSGEERIIAWHNTVLTDEAGAIWATLSSGEDITERRRAEEALRKSQAELKRQVSQQEALLHISQAVQALAQPSDLERVVQVCYEQFQDLGLDFQALAIQRLIEDEHFQFESYEVQPSKALHRMEITSPNLHRIWQSKETSYRPDLEVDLGGLRPGALEGIHRRYGVRIRCILNVPYSRGLLSMLSVRSDAFSQSEIRFVEQVTQELSLGVSRVEDLELIEVSRRAFQESQEQLQGLLEHLPDGICLLDGELRLTMANPSAQAYLSMLSDTAEEEVLSHLGEYSIEEILAPREDGLDHKVAAEGPPPRIFEVAARSMSEELAGGGWILVIRDATREREVQERAQQQDRLAAVGQLAAGIAHDFNNLLTIMMGFAQMLEMRDDVPDQAKGDLKSIFTQGQRAAQLIRQILDFSRKTVVQRQPTGLMPFLKEAVKLLERTLPETIRIATGFEGGGYIVQANLAQLQEVITNLAVNARDAMPNGGELRIEVSSLQVERGKRPPLPEMETGPWVVWRVSDTGVGMPPEMLEHIYEPFFTSKQPGEGTGLGLAQVYGIVKQHEGLIDVESEVGKGTAFTIYLPQITKETFDLKADADIPRGREETILVVEDDPGVLQAAGAMLELLNYRVLTAANGREGLDAYDAHRGEIALVMTDMVMPEMGGVALFEDLRERDPEIRMVFMTGYSAEMEVKPRLLREAAGYLEKPLILERMAQVIREALEG